MNIEQIKTSELIPYARNAKLHSDAQVAAIAGSIKEFGFNNPVLIDKDNGIIAGHGRVLAAQLLKREDVPCIKLAHLSETQKRAYILADNRLAETGGGWNYELLKLEIDDLKAVDFDIALTGFDVGELEKMLGADGGTEGLTDPDAVPDAPAEPVCKLGDMWQLGRHKLMCGDSTDKASVEKLMGGEKTDMVFTDPPYNVAFNGRSGKHEVIKNDDLPQEQFEQFIAAVCNVIQAISPEAYYIWCNWNFYGTLQKHLPYKACIVWAKNVFGMGQGYRHQHEFCLFSGKVDEAIKNESDLWSISKDSNYVHPTQKPVALSVRAFRNHAKLLNILDLFGGSGSTLIGAEQTNRNCYMMELDPRYCDVIIKRWQDFTGGKAELLK